MEDKRSLVKSVSLLSIMMIFLKIFGFIKQSVIAYFFGADKYTDIYYIAYGFVSGISDALIHSVSISVIAIYTDVLIKRGKTYADELVTALFEIMIPMLLAIMLVIYFGARFVSFILAPQYTGIEKKQLAHYIHVVLPFMIFSMFILICTAILDANKDFILPRLQSFIYSIVVIIFCVFFSKRYGVSTLIWAQYTSYVIFLGLLFIKIRKYYRFRLVKFLQLSKIVEIKKIIISAIPLFIGNGALQINEIVDKSITSGIQGGATSALAYCHVLEQFVTAVLITNVCAVIFSHFAEYVAKQEINQIQNVLHSSINIMLCILIGVAVISVLFSEEIVRIVYYRGNFSRHAVNLTSTALIAYAIGFPFVGVKELVVRSLYAFGDTLYPMKVSILTTLLNVVLSIFLSQHIGIFGVAIATTIAVCISMIANINELRKKIPTCIVRENVITIVKIVISACFMVGIIVLVKILMRQNADVLVFAVGVAAGSVVYLLLLYVLKVEEIMKVQFLITRWKEGGATK